MALGDEIRSLRDRALADLNAAHDYYADTQMAWRIVRRVIAEGHTFSVENLTTGTITTHADLDAKSAGYVAEQLAEATFQQFLAIFENFFADLLRLWLLAYPQSLGTKTVAFRDILEAPDKDAIARRVVDHELNEILYGAPKEWFAYLDKRARLGCPTHAEIDQIAEAKASRDVLVHNRGVANKIYEARAGNLSRYADGQRIDLPEYYHRQIWELLRKVIGDLADASIAKAS